jgi:hypothetical protein
MVLESVRRGMARTSNVVVGRGVVGGKVVEGKGFICAERVTIVKILNL